MMAEKKFFKRPEKKETLAGKREEKVRRLNHLRQRLPRIYPERWLKAGEIFAVLLLLLINFYLLFPFFEGEDQANVFSAPIIPALIALFNGQISFDRGVRIWLLVFLFLFPLFFYFFVKGVTGRKLPGILAVLIASLPFSVFESARIHLGLLGEDGAHIASLSFIPLVCLLLLRFLRFGNFFIGVISSLGTTVVALISPVGFFVLTIFLIIIAFSEMFLGQGRLKLIRLFVVLILAIGFSAFWYNPKFVSLIFHSFQGQFIVKTLGNLLPISFFVVPIVGVFGFLLFENRTHLQAFFIALFLTLTFGLLSLGALMSYPTPARFFPALGISLAFLGGILITWVFDFLRNSTYLGKIGFPRQWRKGISLAFLFLISSLIASWIIFPGRRLTLLNEGLVLGARISEKTGIWAIRGQINRWDNFIGYAISGLTVLGAIFIKKRLKSEYHQ